MHDPQQNDTDNLKCTGLPLLRCLVRFSCDSLLPSSGSKGAAASMFAEPSLHMCSGWFCRQWRNSFTCLPSKQIWQTAVNKGNLRKETDSVLLLVDSSLEMSCLQVKEARTNKLLIIKKKKKGNDFNILDCSRRVKDKTLPAADLIRSVIRQNK